MCAREGLLSCCMVVLSVVKVIEDDEDEDTGDNA